MNETDRARWQQTLPTGHLDLLRSAVPAGIHRAQTRAAAAHEAYHDPDNERHVYGTGMGRGAQKDVSAELQPNPAFRSQPIPGSRRALVFLGDQLLFLHRVGARMPRNHTRIRLDYLPQPRRALLTRTSVHRYDPPALLELTAARPTDAAEPHDIHAHLTANIHGESLLAVCYSSTPDGIGRIFLGPGRLTDGHYLQLIEPEELYRRLPATRPSFTPYLPATGFNHGVRPRTTAKLRPTPPRQNGT